VPLPFLARSRERELPVIVLSALSDEATKVRGLDAGAADYVTKPFGVAELLARIRARLAERPAAVTVLSLGDGEADLARYEFRRGGRRVTLTPTEAALLALLARHPGAAVGREEIVRALWGVEASATRTLDTHVSRLRRKVEPDPRRPRHVVTVHGVGFRLDGLRHEDVASS
jgi:DNA-binding response OmpR family regulator